VKGDPLLALRRIGAAMGVGIAATLACGAPAASHESSYVDANGMCDSKRCASGERCCEVGLSGPCGVAGPPLIPCKAILSCLKSQCPAPVSPP
jgi:hypothetical protein